MKSNNLKDKNYILAESFVNQTGCNVFLTGNAGSGKTTFLHHIANSTHKNFVIVAPTGVAAINAGGMTIHSFFQIPIGMFVPEASMTPGTNISHAVFNARMLLKQARIGKQKRKLMEQLELLIIDEVSMVRADVMDAVDTVLRYIRKRYDQAFGGVQVLMIGDLYQLPPVVTDSERNMLLSCYSTPYFFSSRVISKSVPVRIELDRIHRQKDEKFIRLLNKVRLNTLGDEDMKMLNNFYHPGFRPGTGDKFITLCSHHYKANAINDEELNILPGKIFSFEAEIKGEINESAIPAEQVLTLKKGAQVMFVKNDTGEERRYYNGKIGTVSEIDADGIRIGFPGDEDGLMLERETWKNIRYILNDTNGSIEEKELGTFTQYPVRLAWAITIHKSQGLTFERAVIDAGDSFTSGQVYVALSRLRSMEGLVLRTPIDRKSIISDRGLNEFLSAGQEDTDKLLEEKRKQYLKTLLTRSMDWKFLMAVFQDFITLYQDKDVAYREEAVHLGKKCLEKTRDLDELAGKFLIQALKLYGNGEGDLTLLAARIEAAHDYFREQLESEVLVPLKEHTDIMSRRSRIQKYLKSLEVLRQRSVTRLMEIRQLKDLFMGLAGGGRINELFSVMKESREKHKKIMAKAQNHKKPRKGDSHRISFDLYNEGKTIAEIARERMLHPGTIESHLVHFIREGKLDVFSFVTEEKYTKIHAELKKDPGQSITAIRNKLDNKYSYNEIRAVMNHLDYLDKKRKL